MKRTKLLINLIFVFLVSFFAFKMHTKAITEVSDIKIDKVSISPEFKEDRYEYIALISRDIYETSISVDSSEFVAVLGDGEITLQDNEYFYVTIMNNNGEVSVYSFKSLYNVALLNNIKFTDIPFDFNPKIYYYELEVPFSVNKIIPNVTSSPNTTYEINNTSLKVGDNTIIIRALEAGKKTGEYIFKINREAAPKNNFSYAGKEEKYVVPYTGNYKLEVWGASGNIIEGSDYIKTGYGGYATGEIYLEKGTELYINVGGKGTSVTATKMAGGYNGGGNAYDYSDGRGAGSGGGATHIALSSGLLSSLSAKKNDILIVAGGGGGVGNFNNMYTYSLIGGSGGGESGVTGFSQGSGSTNYYGYGGTQTNAGSSTNTGGTRGGFGQGGNCNNNNNCSGGGGGLYGGGYNTNWSGAGGGGSGYIGNSLLTNKVMYCYNCTASNTAASKTVTTTNVSDKEVSGYAKKGDGYARITYIDKTSNINDIVLNDGNIPLSFDKDTYEYSVIVDEDVDKLKIEATTDDLDALIIGNGIFDINGKTNDYEIVFTSPSSGVKVYNIHVTRTPSSYKYLSGIKINGTLLKEFEYDNDFYEIEIPSIFDKINIEAIPGVVDQTITGDGIIEFKGNTAIVDILVISEDKNETTSYRLSFTREKSTKLRNLVVENGLYEIVDFSSNKYDYDLEILNNTLTLPLIATPCYNGASVTITGNKYIGESDNLITILVELDGVESTTYSIHLKRSDDVKDVEFGFDYTNGEQVYPIPMSGTYKLETWGASGNVVKSTNTTVGYGGYSTGEIFLTSGTKLYINVGGQGVSTTKTNMTTLGGYNGGGNAHDYADVRGAGSGGGATHIALSSGLLSSLSTKKDDILIVAGGGGGVGNYTGLYFSSKAVAGSGGGYIGGTGYTEGSKYYYGYGGTQTAAGSSTSASSVYSGITGGFGQGGNCNLGGEGNCSGGGGGYYGGGWNTNYSGAGGGGSGYIGNTLLTNKEMYCYNCSGSSAEATRTLSTINYSNDPISEYAKVGNGYAKITLLKSVSSDNYLDSITLNDGNVAIDFEPWIEEYRIHLSSDITELKVGATPKDSTSVIEGIDTYKIPPLVETEIVLKVTATDNSIREYKLKVTRDASSNPYPDNIEITNMLKNLCKEQSDYCKYTFNKENTLYEITVPYRQTSIDFNVILNSDYQSISAKSSTKTIDDETKFSFDLEPDLNTFEITVNSEDNSQDVTYTYKITRDIAGNNFLADLKIKNPTIEFDFDPYVYEYFLNIGGEYTSYDLEYVTEHKDATVTYSGNTNLKVGMNNCIVTVTAPNGNTKVYLLHVYKEQDNNVFLSDLKVKHNEDDLELSPTFNKLLNDYTVNVDNSISTISVEATAESGDASVSGNTTYNLVAGLNIIPVTVTSSDGNTTNTYNINVYRAKNSNAYLENIELPTGYSLDPIFNREETEYFVTIPRDVTKLELIITPEVSTTTYKVTGNLNLIKDENEIVITSIAEDKSFMIYHIYVSKELSDNNDLSSLKVLNNNEELVLTPPFDKNETNYTINVDNSVNNVLVEALASEKSAKVSGNGTYYLQPGTNTIEVIVTSETLKTKTYTITINREENDDVTLKEIKNSQNSTVIKADNETDYDYIINVQYEVSSISLEGIPNASTSKVVGNGTFNLKTGNNDFILNVTAENGDSHNYVVRVVRDLSTNDDLAFLYVHEGGLNPSFNETIINYDVKIPYRFDSVTIEAESEDPNALVKIIGDLTNIEVGVPRKVIVRVVAEKGKNLPEDEQTQYTKDYTINIIRQVDTTENLSLLSIETNRGDISPTFNPTRLNYTLEVENNIEDIDITATPISDDVNVIGNGNYKLKVGKNLISIFVEGNDGIEQCYQIVVTRKKSNDATLASLVVKSHTLSPKFNSNIENYTLSTSLSKLDFTTIKPTENEATYEVIGNENFTTGENIVIIRVTAPDGETTKDYTLTVTKEASKNNNLKSLSVDGYEISPNFHKVITFYSIDVENNVNNIFINATPEDENATVTGIGLQTVKSGETFLEIIVTSEANTTKTYTILVTKDASDNNYLQTLVPSSGELNPNFDKTNNDYTLEVENDIDRISFYAVAEDAGATISGFDEQSLVVGDNDIVITVTSEAGSVNLYNVKVTRKPLVSAYLNDLDVDNYDLDTPFNKELEEYYIDINYETSSFKLLNLNYIKEDSLATVEISINDEYSCNEADVCEDYDFNIGMNDISITVTASDNETTKTYIVHVNRQMSTNNYLEYLNIPGYTITPDFDKEVLEYNLEVDRNVEKITIEAEKEDSNATILSGSLGEKSLNLGLNTFTIKVRSSVGIVRTYKVNVTRKQSTNNYLASLNLYFGEDKKEVDIGFDKDNDYYEVETDHYPFVNIKATLADSTASLVGDGVKLLVTGENTFEVVVTAENGDIKTYTIVIDNPKSSNNNLTSIIPSSGELSPTFDKDEINYTLNLDSDVNTLSFDVTPESNTASVKGHEISGVDEGTSVRNIEVTAENGIDKKTYTITVIKPQSSDARLESLEIEGYPFEFSSDEFIYNIKVSNSKKKLLESEIIAVAKDENATINMMGDLELKDGIVNIYTIEVIAKDEYTTQTYTLNITRDSEEYTLRSDLYEIVRFEEDEDNNEDYVIGIQPSTVISDFKNNFENEPEMLKVYLDDSEVEETDLTATAFILKLEKDGYVYDTLRVIVRGDLTKDGKVNITDQVKMINYVGRTTTFDKYQMLAGDLTFDGKVNITDQVKIINYVGRTISDLNNKPTS